MRNRIAKEELERLYVGNQLTMIQISEHLGIPRTTLERWRREWGIPTLNRGPVMVGKRFGRLVVIGTERSGGRGVPTNCRCLCDCGKETVIAWSNLQQKRVHSCGCLVTDHNKRPDGMSTRQSVLNEYRHSAKVRNLVWGLTDEQAFALFTGRCHYCGAPPTRVRERKDLIGTYTFNGIDRVSNSLGYVPDNVVPCCYECNLAKSKSEKTDFLQHAMKIGTSFPEAPVPVATDDKGSGWAWAIYQAGALSRGLPFDLSKELVRELVAKPCRYCGAGPRVYKTWSTSGGKRFPVFTVRNGLDRIDNALGYTERNCAPCCPDCNRMKGKRDAATFLAWASRVQAHQVSQSNSTT